MSNYLWPMPALGEAFNIVEGASYPAMYWREMGEMDTEEITIIFHYGPGGGFLTHVKQESVPAWALVGDDEDAATS